METFLNGVALVGVPVVVLIPLIIMWLKQIGLPTSWTGVATAVIGILVAALIQAVKEWPRLEPLAWILVFGIIMGLAGNGLNSQWKHLVKTREADAGKRRTQDLKADQTLRPTGGTPWPLGDSPEARTQLSPNVFVENKRPLDEPLAGQPFGEYPSRDVVPDEQPPYVAGEQSQAEAKPPKAKRTRKAPL